MSSDSDGDGDGDGLQKWCETVPKMVRNRAERWAGDGLGDGFRRIWCDGWLSLSKNHRSARLGRTYGVRSEFDFLRAVAWFFTCTSEVRLGHIQG